MDLENDKKIFMSLCSFHDIVYLRGCLLKCYTTKIIIKFFGYKKIIFLKDIEEIKRKPNKVILITKDSVYEIFPLRPKVMYNKLSELLGLNIDRG